MNITPTCADADDPRNGRHDEGDGDPIDSLRFSAVVADGNAPINP